MRHDFCVDSVERGAADSPLQLIRQHLKVNLDSSEEQCRTNAGSVAQERFTQDQRFSSKENDDDDDRSSSFLHLSQAWNQLPKWGGCRVPSRAGRCKRKTL